ncbi:MAG: MerR family transcriptional regulator [Balneolales bacterium]|nr:MerR family transcriptional regulator [Balneolales bacterium]
MEKLYYSIGEVSKLTDVESHVLRYWETVFTELSPAKNNSGKRTYTKEDIEVVMRLKVLIKDKAYSTEGAKRALRNEDVNQQKLDFPEQQDVPIPEFLKKDLREIRLLLKEIAEKL